MNWEIRYQEFISFKEKNGHQVVPSNAPELYSLKRWILSQRHQYVLKMQGKPSFMTDERIKALEAQDFVWNPQEELWEMRLKELIEFKANSGHW